jgi:hypothetical protein
MKPEQEERFVVAMESIARSLEKMANPMFPVHFTFPIRDTNSDEYSNPRPFIPLFTNPRDFGGDPDPEPSSSEPVECKAHTFGTGFYADYCVDCGRSVLAIENDGVQSKEGR